MMTYSQPTAYYFDQSSTLPKGNPNKPSQLSEQRYYGSPSSTTSSHNSYSMTGSTAHPRTLPPYISVHRASEPASPATIATTISSHSTPSPSPSRNTNMSSNQPGADFTLFDDAIIAAAHDLGGGVGKGRANMDIPTSMPEQGLTNYTTNGFPIIVPHDAPYSNYGPSAMYTAYSAPDTNSNVYNLNNDQSHIPQTQRSTQQNKYLRPASYRELNSSQQSSMANGLSQHRAGEVESVENVPALSPTSQRQNGNSPTASKFRPASGSRSPKNNKYSSAACEEIYSCINSWLDEYLRNPSDLHSALPKLGRTISDAVQDELYNPELISHPERESQQQQGNGKMMSMYSANIKNENRNSFPQIFQEAQQQHQQDFSSQSTSRHHPGARERSPFRNTSPFHPSSQYNVPYGSDGSLHQSQLGQGLDHDQMAIAMVLREQMRKEAEQAVAPKTISPRDSLLEYNEPESQHSHMSLFPSVQAGRLVQQQQQQQQEDALSNGSLHASSHEGSDMDDFHSMATSRRASMANSSVSSHLDVPRFNYLQQQQPSAYDAVSSAPYYYTDANAMGGGIPMADSASIPYIKEEIDYAPVQRPLNTTANTGTYTCTYSGCGQRFTTSTKLQKHRREAHRKATPSGNSVSTAAAIASRNAQPGPHRCMRVNPSTGRPCNTVFSRPYDLTRHEDTIHNSAKEKVRCEICNDEKTFSRPDALVRHRRVKHGIH